MFKKFEKGFFLLPQNYFAFLNFSRRFSQTNAKIAAKAFTTSKKITEERQKHFINNLFQKLQETPQKEPVFEEPKVKIL